MYTTECAEENVEFGKSTQRLSCEKRFASSEGWPGTPEGDKLELHSHDGKSLVYFTKFVSQFFGGNKWKDEVLIDFKDNASYSHPNS